MPNNDTFENLQQLLDPGKNPPPSVNINLNEIIKKIDSNLDKDILEKIWGKTSSSDFPDKLDKLKNIKNCDDDIIKELYKEFEQIEKNEKNNQNEKIEKIKKWKEIICYKDKINNKYKFLFDTCYDKDKAEKLKRVLDNIMNIDSTGKLILLLAAVYAHVSAEPSVYDSYEWFISFMSRYAKNKDGYLPECPWKGDAVAIIYYIIEKGINDDIAINKDDIVDIIKNIIIDKLLFNNGNGGGP